MSESKACPLCDGTMRVHEREAVQRVPGDLQTTTRTVREWVCPDCDNFEEAEEEGE